MIDLGHCIVNGAVTDWAEELIQICDTYTGYSPSGSGFHLILEDLKLVDQTRFHQAQAWKYGVELDLHTEVLQFLDFVIVQVSQTQLFKQIESDLQLNTQ